MTWLPHKVQANTNRYAGHLQLLKDLISFQQANKGLGIRAGPHPGAYPDQLLLFMSSCKFFHVSKAQICAYAAMQRGCTEVLSWGLLSAGSAFKAQAWRLQQLFRNAVRHSNAACVQLLLEFAPSSKHGGLKHLGNPTVQLVPWPQHLAMAAGRADPWAAEVVSLLLRFMASKLLAAKYIKRVYSAACRTGRMPVLRQLADAAAEHHVPFLLKSLLHAGNRSTWQQLLGSGPTCPHCGVGAPVEQKARNLAGLCANTSSSGQGEPACRAPPDWPHVKGAAAWGKALAELLYEFTSGRFKRDADYTDIAAYRIADSAWQLLGFTSPDKQHEFRCSMKFNEVLDDAAPWAACGMLQNALGWWSTGALAWLAKHDILPDVPADWWASPAASWSLENSIYYCLAFGWREGASVLWQLVNRLRAEVSVAALVQGCLTRALRDAAAAQVVAAVQLLYEAAAAMTPSFRVGSSTPAAAALTGSSGGTGTITGSTPQQADQPTEVPSASSADQAQHVLGLPAAQRVMVGQEVSTVQVSKLDAAVQTSAKPPGQTDVQSSQQRVSPLWLIAVQTLAASVAGCDALGVLRGRDHVVRAALHQSAQAQVQVPAALVPFARQMTPAAGFAEQPAPPPKLQTVLGILSAQMVWAPYDVARLDAFARAPDSWASLHRLDVPAWACHPSQQHLWPDTQAHTLSAKALSDVVSVASIALTSWIPPCLKDSTLQARQEEDRCCSMLPSAQLG